MKKQKQAKTKDDKPASKPVRLSPAEQELIADLRVHFPLPGAREEACESLTVLLDRGLRSSGSWEADFLVRIGLVACRNGQFNRR